MTSRQFWARILGPDAISWVTVVVGYPVVIAANLVASGVDVTRYTVEVVAAGTAGAGALFAVMFGGRYALLRGPEPRLARTAGVVVVAFAARAWVFDAALLALGATDEQRMAYRFISSFATIGVALGGVAFAVSLARDVARDAAALESTRAETKAAAADVAGRIEARSAEVVEQIRTLLTARLAASITDAPEQVLARMRDTIETVVRPISHALSRQIGSLTERPQRQDPPRRIDVRAVLRGATAGDPFRPGWLAGWAAMGGVLFAPILPGIANALGGAAAGMATSWVLLTAARRAWPHLVAGRGPVARSLVYSGLLMVVIALTSPVAEIGTGNTVDTGVLTVPLIVLWTISGWVVALAVSLAAEHRRVSTALAMAAADLHATLVRLTTAEHFQRRAIGRALHGPVQDALAAATFRLSRAVEAGTATGEMVADLLDSLLPSLLVVDPSVARAPDLRQQLTTTAELWEGISTLRWQLADDACTALAASPATTQSVAEVVREACSNAIRHGEATWVDVAVGTHRGSITVEVRDDGNGLRPGSRAGYGTQLFDELTLRWSLHREGAEQRFTAVLPII